jgi:hypothetical protein
MGLSIYYQPKMLRKFNNLISKNYTLLFVIQDIIKELNLRMALSKNVQHSQNRVNNNCL